MLSSALMDGDADQSINIDHCVNKRLNKASVMAVSWGVALLISLALRSWGTWHPEPLQASLPLALLLVFAPASLLAIRLLGGGKGESGDSD